MRTKVKKKKKMSAQTPACPHLLHAGNCSEFWPLFQGYSKAIHGAAAAELTCVHAH